MGFMTIDGQRVEFTNEPNVLTVIRNAEIDIPTLCYHSELSIYGACRLCTVEDDRGKTFASCAEPPRDGMVIYTNTPRLMRYRRTILELLLAAHDRDCTTCVKSGECHLLELAHRMGVDRIRFKNREAKYPIDESSPAIVRNPNKCILCGDCVRMCDNVQSVNAIDFAYRGTSTLVTPAFNKTIAQTNCVNCGQCRVVCPTGAISIKTNIDEVWDALADPNTIVVAQVAPAVRVALGDKFGIPKGENVMGKLVNALHRLGFHEVYDTTYGADLTVIEEAEELLERISSGAKGPLFTSCCPAWVKFCETRYPELADNISTCRSPQQMFGAVAKSWLAHHLGIEPEIPGLPGFQGHTGRQRAACAVSANGYAALIAAPLGTVDKGIGRCVIALVKCHRPRSHRRGGVIQVHHDAPEPVGQIAAVKGVALHVGRHKTAAVDVDVDRAVLGPVFGAVDIEGILIVIHRPLDDLLSAEGAVVLIFLRVLGCLGPLGAHRGTLQDVHQLLMPFFRKCHCLCLLCYRCASRIARMIRCCACCHCPAIRTVKPWGLSRYS